MFMNRAEQGPVFLIATLMRALRLFLPFALLLCGAAFYVNHVETEQQHAAHARQESEAVRAGEATVTSSIQVIARNLVNFVSLQQNRLLVNQPDDKSLARLAKAWVAFAQNSLVYDKIRWIDENGKERLRVEYDEPTARIARKSELEGKDDRGYFRKTVKLNEGEIYVSPIRLHGETVPTGTARFSVIRFGMPLFDAEGKRRGIILVNYSADYLLNQFESEISAHQNSVWLLNKDGYWLKGQSRADEFGFMFGRDDLTMAQRYPKAWEKIADSEKGQFETNEGLWTFSTAYPFKPIQDRRGSFKSLSIPKKNGGYAWKVVSLLPAENYYAGIVDFRKNLASGMALLLLLFFVFSWRFAKIKIAKEENDARLRSLLDTMPDLVWLKDDKGVFLECNPAFQRFFGKDVHSVIGKTDQDILPPELALRLRAEDVATISAGKPSTHEDIVTRPGSEHPSYLETTSVPVKTESGELIGVLGISRDITARKRADELIWQQANYDLLTELPNRRMFHELLEQAIRKAKRYNTSLAMLFIDLDHFKDINDTFGHYIGDTLLKEAAERLRRCVRESDIVARAGGDEFVVLLDDVIDPSDVNRVAQNILSALSSPFNLDTRIAHVSASVGVTFYPEDATTIEDLMKNADHAMYAAKNSGRNRFQYYVPAMQEEARQRMSTMNDLRAALAEHPFVLHYQPIVELATGKIKKAEALIRWLHPERGLVNPTEFIPISEQSGMIGDITDWVFRTAARQTAIWRATTHAEFQVNINLSPVIFLSENNLLDSWLEMFAEMGLPGEGVAVEITEGILLDGRASITDRLFALRDAGIQVALDDFGTGFCSLSYLKKFDIDYIKIDRSFIQNLAPSSNDMALVEAIIVMAHKLGLKVVGEGVETEAQRNLLIEAGCDYAQGNLFSKPLPPDELESFLKARLALPRLSLVAN